MFRQVAKGTAAVLAIGLLAAGCSDKTTNILGGSGNQLQNTDSVPFTAVTAANLSPDGGGFSPNGSDGSIARFEITFNCDCAKSDGTFSGDNSAIVLFQMANNRVYASYLLDTSFTPPVQLEAQDRDYGVAVDLDSYIAVPLNTSAYQSGNSTPAAEVNTVRNNAGNWVIIGNFTTKFVLPGQTENTASSLGKGVRQTIGSWIFLKGQRGNGLSTSSAVGGVTREFRYGFQRVADEIATTHVTGVVGSAPANHVQSYGVATDGLCGQASWEGGNIRPWLGPLASPSNTAASGAALANNYRVGENVSTLACVFTQQETTLSSDSNELRRDALDAATQNGEQLELRYRTFNLATMAWGTEARIQRGVSIHGTNGSTEAGTGVVSDFFTYNNTVLYRYMDASMLVQPSGVTGFVTNTLSISFRRQILAATRFIDQGNGTSLLSGVIDVSTDTFCVADQSAAAGTPGTHTTSVPSTTTTVVLGSREDSSFFSYDGDSAQTQSVYGPDEGLGEINLFYSIADGTSSGSGVTGSGPNSDAELAVVVFNATGTISTTSFVAGTNPLRLSGAHAIDTNPTGSTTNQTLTDPISTPRFAMNRTGQWIGIAFTRLNGVSESSAFQRNMYVNIYQPFRPVASTTQAGSTGGTVANVDARDLAALLTVDNPSSGSLNAASPNGTEIPAGSAAGNLFGWQGMACYRGRQSNRNIMNLFWEQSDGTGDRVFGARMTVTVGSTGTPTCTASSAVELAFANNVLGDAAFFTSGGAPGTTSFEWLEGSARVTNETVFRSCDSGPDSSGNGGNVLVVFTRVEDATNTDSGSNDDGDVAVYATVFTGTAFETPVQIGTTADTNEAIAGIATQANITLEGLDALPNNTDIVNRPDYPTAADGGYIAIFFRDREASLFTASGGTTPTVSGGNNSTRLAFMERTLRTVDGNANPARTSVDTRIVPSVLNTTASPFALPVVLEHEQGVTTDAASGDLRTCQRGTGLGIVFRSNNQLWYQATNDGIQFLKDNSTGLSNPGLISNFSSADVTAFDDYCCTDGNGDGIKVVIPFTKQDTAGTTRLFAVVGTVN